MSGCQVGQDPGRKSRIPGNRNLGCLYPRESHPNPACSAPRQRRPSSSCTGLHDASFTWFLHGGVVRTASCISNQIFFAFFGLRGSMGRTPSSHPLPFGGRLSGSMQVPPAPASPYEPDCNTTTTSDLGLCFVSFHDDTAVVHAECSAVRPFRHALVPG